MVGERFGTDATLWAFVDFGEAGEAERGILTRRIGLERTWGIVDAALLQAHLHVAVTLEMHDRTFGSVDGELLEIGATEARQLGVDVGKDAALQKRIVGKVDAGDDVADTESGLFGFGEEIIDVAIENQASDFA